MKTIIISLILYLFSSTVLAGLSTHKTPDDVFYETMLLIDEVKILRKKAGITIPWPNVPLEQGREPRHVLQKATEILDKINRYRKNIAKTGEIAVSRFLGRDITPDEVFFAVSYLHKELELLTQNLDDYDGHKNIKVSKGKTPAHVYAKLSEVSIVLDESLGLHGITPSEVFARSKQVIDIARFLRQSQNLDMSISKPIKTSGKLPNHALKSVQGLLKKINQAEKNLWMKPVKVPAVPKQVIKPGDVYDAMGVVLVELQRIQYRLGLERNFPKPEIITRKTPDDVIFNTKLAQQLLPDFPIKNNLQQYDRRSLIKTPSHVFSVTKHVLMELNYYRKQKGIQVKSKPVPMVKGLKAQNVYSKTLEALRKINILREKIGLEISAVPDYPLRKITPQEVFDIVLLLDEQLEIIYQHIGVESFYWANKTDENDYSDKVPSDVYQNVWEISELLDTVLGEHSFTSNKMFQKASDIFNEATIVFNKISTNKIKTGRKNKKNTEVLSRITLKDVFKKSTYVLDLVLNAKHRAGMFDVEHIAATIDASVKPSNVYNQLELIETELIELKAFLGIDQSVEKTNKSKNKKPEDTYKILTKTEVMLNTMLDKQVDK